MKVIKVQRADIICEAPSKFRQAHPSSKPASPELRYDEYHHEYSNNNVSVNVTYLFSKFKQSWSGARDSCTLKGGWLAEPDDIEKNRHISRFHSEWCRENENLRGRDCIEDFWLGARLNGTTWRWSQDHRKLMFFNWTQSYAGKRKNEFSQCLTLTESSKAHHWSETACVNWRHFVCEIWPEGVELVRPNLTDFVGEKRCFENGTKGEKACLQFVKLQFTNEEAREFCRDQLGGSLARFVGVEERRKFNEIITEELTSLNVRQGLIEEEEIDQLSVSGVLKKRPDARPTDATSEGR